MACPTPGREIDPRPFLLHLSATPYRWRTMNCALAVADYWLWATGRNFDPAGDWRDRFDTAEEFAAELAKKGGLPVLIARTCRDLGLPKLPPGVFLVGCIAVVRFGFAGGPVRHHAAIRTPSGRWAMKCTDGIVIATEVKAVAAWGVAP